LNFCFASYLLYYFKPSHCRSVAIEDAREQHKRGPLSLVSTTEELLDRKVAAPV
jgi:hypothetical protein